MTEKEAADHNAVAWLKLSDDELAERSGSLGLPGNLGTYTADHLSPDDAVKATPAQIKKLRAAADAHAVGHAGKKFVDAWIKENR